MIPSAIIPAAALFHPDKASLLRARASALATAPILKIQ
jgi:hypothetical protein